MKTKRLMMIAVIFGMAMSVSAQEVSESSGQVCAGSHQHRNGQRLERGLPQLPPFQPTYLHER